MKFYRQGSIECSDLENKELDPLLSGFSMRNATHVPCREAVNVLLFKDGLNLNKDGTIHAVEK